LSVPTFATVTVTSLKPSPKSPQPVGTTITWNAEGTDTNGAGLLTFQFKVQPPGGKPAIVIDFNAGTLSSGTWTSQPFVWTPTGIAGAYEIEVVAKDFMSGEQASKKAQFIVAPLVTGNKPVVAATANPLVALFSAQACAAGSTQRVSFQQQSLATPATLTPYKNCDPASPLTFEIAGMYAHTTYIMFSETDTRGMITDGPTITFTTGELPATITFPPFEEITPPGPGTDTAERMILLSPAAGTTYPAVATDLSAGILWYYYDAASPNYNLVTRPLHDGGMLVILDGQSWGAATTQQQLLRQIDLAGNIVHETNTGVIRQELLALGATDAGPCDAIPQPPPVGTACLGAFYLDAIKTLPNGDTAVIADIEKIFPPGTQGGTSGLPVDIIGDIVIVLNADWQVVFYSDSFTDGLNVNRPPVLPHTCAANAAPSQECPPPLLAPKAMDWIHANSLYYWPTDNDIVWSLANQNLVVKIDYNNGTGTVWQMGVDGDFTFNNITNDPYPWFSNQNDVYFENNGIGPLSVLDNGDTRIAVLGSPGCMPNDCLTRGMALTVDEAGLTVTPVLSQSLRVYSPMDGSLQMLPDGNLYFLAATVNTGMADDSYSFEFASSGTVLNIQGPRQYRGWRMPDLYHPPTY